MSRPSALPHLIVEIRLFRPSEGGRQHPVTSGYRPQAWFGEREGRLPLMYGFQLDLLDREWLELGEMSRARLTPISPDRWVTLKMGDRIRIYEGRNHVGDAYVGEVHLSDALPNHGMQG